MQNLKGNIFNGLWRCLLWMVCLCSLPAVGQHYSFNKITQTAGLEFPSRLINIFEDSRGYLWISTRSGLGRYDGNSLKNYMEVDTDSLSLPSNDVYYVTEDNDQDLWICTLRGVVRYDYQYDQFIPLYNNEGETVKAYAGCAWQSGILFASGHKILYLDKPTGRLTVLAEFPGNYWTEKMVLLDNNRLLCQCRSHRIFCFQLNGTEEMSGVYQEDLFANTRRTTDIVVDSKNRIWITSRTKGLYCYSPDGELLKQYQVSNSALPTDFLLSVTECQRHIVIGTSENGVVVLNPETGEVRQHQNSPGEDQFTLPGNKVNRVFCDRHENLLMGIIDHGLVVFDTVYLRTYTSQSSGFGKGPTSNSIMSIVPDGERIWIGTANDGVNLFHPADNSFHPVRSTHGMNIFSMCHFTPGKLLLSIFTVGCRIMDMNTGQLTPFQMVNDSINQLISTFGNGNYVFRTEAETILLLAHRLYIYHLQSGLFTEAHQPEGEEFVGGTLRMVCSNKECSYLVDRQRLFRLDHRTEQMTVVYSHNVQGEVINSATKAADGVFWFGTNNGLMTYDPQTNTVEHIPSEYFKDIVSVQADTGIGRIWIGTYYGLFSYNPIKKLFVAYNQMDGAAPNEYIRTATAIQDDKLYMGGVKGFVQVYFKQAIRPNAQPVFTVSECSLNGMRQGNPFASKTDVEVELPSRSNFFIKLLTQDKNRFRSRHYRFLVPNYTKEPIETNNGMLLLYNLLPGKYHVQASCSLNDGSWSEYQDLASFEVLPPWYLSTWFILTNIAVAIVLLSGGFWVYNERKNRRLAREMVENRMQLKQEKIDFLVNVSHELRTPLTLIYAPLNRMLRESSPADKHFRLLQTACRQSSRMTHIINMVLDLEKMERKTVKLQMQPHPFNTWVANQMKDFVSEGEERSVQVVFQPDGRIDTVPFDCNKCEIVLNNLLMNALKHSPANTTLTVKTLLDVPSGEVRVTISDEGTGLQPGDEKELFTRFYQGAKESTGTGLGLAYSKVLLEQHGGTIGAYNNPDKGATFFFTLPLKQETTVVTTQVETAQLIPHTEKPVIGSATPEKYAAEQAPADEQAPTASAHTEATILVVDDQEAITEFLQDALKDCFKQVLTAKDGVDALKVLRNNRPDAVVSDVMMPRMDGFELCRQIKQDLNISHVPVILLTAKTDDTSVRTGYKLGADMYLPKPFDLEVLKNILFNLLATRNRMQEKYAVGGPMPLPEEVTISYADEAFLTKLNQLIEKHIDNSALDVPMIESEMCMSRATLFNKMKALTGMGCNEYITKIRMERAIQLVTESKLTFVEISEKVGYNTASYFSTAFKQYTGMTPTQYRRSQKRSTTPDNPA